MLALLAADNGDFDAAYELAAEGFSYRKQKGDVSYRMGASVGFSLAFAIAAGQATNVSEDIQSWASPDAPETAVFGKALAVADGSSTAGEARQGLEWAAPKVGWTLAGSLFALASLAPDNAEAWLDTFQPPVNLMSYFHARARVAMWRGDDDAAAKWSKRIEELQSYAKDPKRAQFLDVSH